MACRCQTLPETVQGGGTFFFVLPEMVLLDRFVTLCRMHGWTVEQEDTVVRVACPEATGVLNALCNAMQLESFERDNIQALFVPNSAAGAPTALRPSDLAKLRPLSVWCGQNQAVQLREVLQERRLIVHFQPIVRLCDGSVYAHEALIRGKRSDGTLIPPNVLFTQARQADLLFPLDRAARETIIETAARLGYRGRLFINFLPSAIYVPQTCLATTFAVAQRCGYDPSQLVFEVVETESIQDIAHLRHILDHYRAKGFQTALDDVGSGYSSLNLLASLAPNYVKLDRELISNIPQEPLKQAIVGALVAMAKQAGILTLAEGVETEAERDFVQAAGVDLAQGYFFARPAPEPVARLF